MAPIKQNVDLRENHNAEIISIAAVFTTLSLLCVIARLVSRKIRRQVYTIDDGLLVAAWVIGLSESIMFTAATRFARGGYHQITLQPHHVVALQKVFYASSFIQTTALALSKISLLILLHRIFEIVRGFQLTCWILGGIVTAWWTAAFFAGAFICYPAAHIWEPNVEGTCGNMALLNVITPVPWVLTDFAILLAPIPVIRKLQLDRSKRLRVYAAFLIGAITCIVTVIRYRSIFYPLDDFSWDIIPAADWNLIEIHVTIMCPALMVSGPVLTYFVSAVQPKLSSFYSWSGFSSSGKGVSKAPTSNDSSSRGASKDGLQNSLTELREVADKPYPSDTVLVEPRGKSRPGGDAYLSLDS